MKNYFKNNIQYLLSSRNILPARLSRDIGISKQAISDWINKDSMITILQAFKIVNYFSITLDTLFFSDLKSASLFNQKDKIEFFHKSEIPFLVLGFDGVLQYCNQAFGHLLGYDGHDLIHRPLVELVHPGDLARHGKDFKKMLSIDDEFIGTGVDLRYLSGHGDFLWVRQFSVSSQKEKKIYIFSTFVHDENVIPGEASSNKFFIRSAMLKEYEDLQKVFFSNKKINLINHLDPELFLDVDQSIFQCLIRSFFYQIYHIETESNSSTVKLSSKHENGKIVVTASLNCLLGVKPLALNRVKTIAKMVNAEVEDICAGNLYMINCFFPLL